MTSCQSHSGINLISCVFFLQLDYPFRKEKVLEKITSKPSCSIVDCFHEIRPLPRTRPRCATLLKMMMPNHMTSKDTCGLLVTSVNHAKSSQSVKVGCQGWKWGYLYLKSENHQCKLIFIIRILFQDKDMFVCGHFGVQMHKDWIKGV